MTDRAVSKFAGAGWIQEKGSTLSPLAVRVANALGQVYSGIYHLTCVETLRRELRENKDSYTVTVFGGVASYDFDQMTRLLLCAQVAGLNVSIAGGRKGYVRLMFKTGDLLKSPELGVDRGLEFSQLLELESEGVTAALQYPLTGGLKARSKYLSVFWDSDREISAVGLKCGAISMERLCEIASRAHSACARAEVEGRSPTSLRLFWSKRSRVATSIMEGHPTAEQAIEKLRPIWAIDYTSID
ncbi:MAG: hypothetical protein ACRCT2_01720 [Plesiomonas shigelloides]